MRMIACALACLLTCLGAAQDNFPKTAVDPIRSGKVAIQHLIAIGAISDGFQTYTGRTASSRFEYALLTHSAWVNFRAALEYLEKGNRGGLACFKPLEPHQKQLATASVELLRLIDEYSGELVKLGADTKHMLKEAKTFKDRFRTSLADRFMKRAEKKEFPDAPAWAFQLLLKMKQDGLLVGCPDGYSSRRPSSRYELAVATHAVSMHILSIVEGLDKDSQLLSAGQPSATKIGAFEKNVREARLMSRYRPNLSALLDEFYFEIVKLGGDPEQVVGLVDSAFYRLDHLTYGEAKQNFADVPPGHWAARAVGELKAAGILHGYQPRKFGG
jgi:hypothetical protein